ncbi:uncharacterized protein LOC122510127 isoform X1 [Leptopilina heterotoma]|uniref:uncharacterized protein LOC122510127 isoform X1 n=1 Tax=Leptopilina heterotoma TaxID=63436 RepID=UPI001CA938D9|nr:uncharacterized protein LOC122510127 isoform X1 [Leptopilina heterotoma]
MLGSDGKPGEFVYFGLEKGIINSLNEEIHNSDTIWLQINADGLPLFKSNSLHLWPILCKIHYEPDIYKPLPVAIFSGTTKPMCIDDYLEEFVIDLDNILENGVIVGNKHFKVQVHCFVCDTPARSFLKDVKGHGAYYACERCTVRGKNVVLLGETKGRVVYPSIKKEKRTDESFRSRKQEKHHKGTTPLINLALNLVTIFVLDWHWHY